MDTICHPKCKLACHHNMSHIKVGFKVKSEKKLEFWKSVLKFFVSVKNKAKTFEYVGAYVGEDICTKHLRFFVGQISAKNSQVFLQIYPPSGTPTQTKVVCRLIFDAMREYGVKFSNSEFCFFSE